jgi:hypothetical protein
LGFRSSKEEANRFMCKGVLWHEGILLMRHRLQGDSDHIH